MSIIYDALQKTQQNREYRRLQDALSPKEKKRSSLKWLLLAAFLMFLGSGLGTLTSWYFKGSLQFTPKPAASTQQAVVTPPPSNSPQSPPLATITTANGPLMLNGVMITGNEKIALINNQPFHLGEVVNGLRIVSIEFNKVILQDGINFIELKVPA